MKNHRVLKIGCILVILFLVIGLYFIHTYTGVSKSKNASADQKEILQSTQEKIRKSDIYAKGIHAIVTKADMKRTIEFYMQSGSNESEATKKALIYEEQREALYQKAISSGYTVTDKEINTYLDTLKEMMKTADNKEQIQKEMSQFSSEEAYWKFEHEVYKKDLPIQKYVKVLEKKQHTSETQTASTDNFNQYLNKQKEILVQKEKYKIIGNLD